MREELCKLIIMVAGVVGAVALTPAALAAVGFTSGGIAAGSIAAKLMSPAAFCYGGGAAAGCEVTLPTCYSLGEMSAASFSPYGRGVAESLVEILLTCFKQIVTGLFGAVIGSGVTATWLWTSCNQTVTP